MSPTEILTAYRDAGFHDREAHDAAKEPLLNLWEANGRPTVIEMKDDRHGDDGKVYFIFTHFDDERIAIDVAYTFPTPESLVMPPDGFQQGYWS